LVFESAAKKAALNVNHINTYLSIESAKATEDDLAILIVNHINTYLSRLFFYMFIGGALLRNHAWLLIPYKAGRFTM